MGRNGEFSIPDSNWTSGLCHGKNAYWIRRNATFPLFSSFPGRIDLGLGRAPGTDQYTANVLRQRVAGEPEFDSRLDELWNDNERRAAEEQLFTSLIGDPADVKQQLHELIEKTDADEIMAHTEIFDHKARLATLL